MFFVQAVSSFFEVCSTSVLRFVNGLLAVLCSIIIYEIILHLRPVLDDRKATLRAVVLALYPLHWFFTFLYYTDVASLTAVLAMYLACLKKNYRLSALVMMSSQLSLFESLHMIKVSGFNFFTNIFTFLFLFLLT